ncbi:Tail assembly chaperone [Xenorhabdus bovienii str. Jollieti]|uniref:Tail assembly chaperone n=1 Tax=Xenorhabdus bovienii (strain SS-2004) TaxID=406818 RepID=D3UZG9_XENBS|nr:phage tail assembly chaperone [Xenorhabdus bovienii]CBJ79812.1 Tail assembly chaperone [Xenorhabdus bovienii SS-2004]CBJ81178.1 Tail assembly chaperone [Xenorhabdus bovienii SS-2004]CDH29160.1 Tail assembly chaperone [Xenorhabdus bovienii str. Jollieti]
MNIRQLALTPKLGFRTKTVTVTEWDNATVTLREPSAGAWIRWNEVTSPTDKEGTLSTAEKVLRNTRADVVLFIDVLCDEHGEPVFTPDDMEAVMDIYAPVHSRLLHQALSLVTTGDEAEKKSDLH